MYGQEVHVVHLTLVLLCKNGFGQPTTASNHTVLY